VQTLTNILQELRNLPSETEWFEFKEANDNFSTNDIGKYFSALCNEANLLAKEESWLIFGINDKTHQITGTDYRTDKIRLQSLKQQIAEETTNRVSFIEIHEIEVDGKRVIMFQIPPAPVGIPVAWKGHYYGREHESLAPLSTSKFDRIRNQRKFDWSAQIAEGATINDLDTKAVEFARKKFKEGNERREFYNEIDTWDTETFLNKARLTIDGKLTKGTLLLLGNTEAKRFLFPMARITYIYIDQNGDKTDYEHYDPPFILERDNLANRLKHIHSKFKLLPTNETIIPIELYRYDNWVILEALNNCIAHMDYTREERIIVTEKANYELIFQSPGNFYYGTIEDYIFMENFTPSEYRNQFLAEAMERLGMIDTVGSGIRRTFRKQKERYLPLPEYFLSSNSVEMTLYGNIQQSEYTKAIHEGKDIDLGLIFLLDKKQKKLPISDKDYKYVIISYIRKNRRVSREEIEKILIPEFEDNLTDDKKKKKVGNLLYSLSKESIIRNISGSLRKPIWALA